MKHLDYKEKDFQGRVKMIQDEILTNYNLKDVTQKIQALGHAKAMLGATQKEMAGALETTERTLRHWKQIVDDEVYKEAVEKFTPVSPELPENEQTENLTEDALEAVYQNLLARLKSSKTSTRDLALVLEYFGVSGEELRAYANTRNKSLRGYILDNEASLLPDKQILDLFRHVIGESEFLFRGTPQSEGNTKNYMQADLSDPLTKLEFQVLGMFTAGLWNGYISEETVKLAKTLRILRLSAGSKVDKNTDKEYKQMDGRKEQKKLISPEMEYDFVQIFGKKQGSELYKQLKKLEGKADEKTNVKLPAYEDIEHDYQRQLEKFDGVEKPLSVMLDEIEAWSKTEATKEKYKEYVQNDNAKAVKNKEGENNNGNN